MRPSSSQQRGAASVETALCMLVIIPVFTYALFLDDLLRYASDLQEAVTSTPWDFTIQNFNKPGEGGLKQVGASDPPAGQTAVQHNARLMFCDHESSGDSYNQAQDCDSLDHHDGKALSGHVCWLNSDAHQVSCETVRTNVGDFSDSVFGSYKGAHGNNGGLFECHGRTVVENYLMPKTFLQKFSKVDLSKENWKHKGSDYHGNAQSGTNDTAYYLEQVRFAIVADPWALNDKGLRATPGTRSGEVWDRVNSVYTNNTAQSAATAAADLFLAQAVSQGLLGDISADPVGTPNISFAASGTSSVDVPQSGGQQGYYSTPWRDQPYQDTHSGRGDYYMGCTSEEGC